MAQFIIIPFGYEELPYPQKDRTIPICIPTVGPDGRPVPEVWLDQGIAPVHVQLVAMAKCLLGDAWQASELAEATIYRLIRRHGADVGAAPSRQVLREAAWVAKDLRYGSRAERRRRSSEVSLAEVGDALVDPIDYSTFYEFNFLVDGVQSRLHRGATRELKETLRLLRHGHTWEEIADRLRSSSQEMLRRRFQMALAGVIEGSMGDAQSTSASARAMRSV